MKKVYIIFVCFNLFLLSCNNSETIKENEIKDRAGNSIVLPQKIESIACLSPAAAEVILSLGLAEKIVSADSTSKEILQTNNIDVSDIIVFDMLNPDSEKMIAIKPDIIFVNTFSVFSGKNSLDSIKASDICIAVIPNSDTIKAIEDDIYFLGDVLSKSEEASNIVNTMEKNIEQIRAIVETITNKKKVHLVLMFIWMI